jgi:hypothetical protein
MRGRDVNPSRRNLWLELAAIGLVLCSLPVLLVGGYDIAVFIVANVSPSEPPLIVESGIVFGFKELLGAVSVTVILAITLIMSAWGLSSLVVDEGEPEP